MARSGRTPLDAIAMSCENTASFGLSYPSSIVGLFDGFMTTCDDYYDDTARATWDNELL